MYHEPEGGHSQLCHGYKVAMFSDNKVSLLDLPKLIPSVLVESSTKWDTLKSILTFSLVFTDFY